MAFPYVRNLIKKKKKTSTNAIQETEPIITKHQKRVRNNHISFFTYA